MKSIAPYPLAWPDHVPRSAKPSASLFKTGLPAAIANVEKSLAAFAADSGQRLADMVITSNAALGRQRPADPGIAVWFTWDGELRCIAVDRYAKIEDNLQAVHHVIEARRTELRHAGIEMARASFRGFAAALPPPADATPAWWTVLGVSAGATSDEIQEAWRAKVRVTPEADRGPLNIARDQGFAARGSK
ncbi:J domain-containing protein [Frigidibacter oleivorans]|uniref:J domain-containing protein n=1 Tax=Frigidibacter oleivorans TaxID=2487129 RepID=UPI000F8D9562|nr:J domain-containing protein [Frigidibacter oleivorans]